MPHTFWSRRILSSLAILGILLGFALLSEANHSLSGTFTSLVQATKARIGDIGFFPLQHTPMGPMDAVGSTAAFYSGAQHGNNPFQVFALADTQLQIGVESVVKIPAVVDASETVPDPNDPEGPGILVQIADLAIGAFLYAEADADSSTVVWGGKYAAYTFSSSSNAVGEQVNAFNRSGSTSPNAFGLNIGMVGDAATDAGLVIETAHVEPAGRPDYGIVLGGPNTTGNPARAAGTTGILIDDIRPDNMSLPGEAIRIMDNNRIALNQAGNTYIRYNSSNNRVQIVRNNFVVAEF